MLVLSILQVLAWALVLPTAWVGELPRTGQVVAVAFSIAWFVQMAWNYRR